MTDGGRRAHRPRRPAGRPADDPPAASSSMTPPEAPGDVRTEWSPRSSSMSVWRGAARGQPAGQAPQRRRRDGGLMAKLTPGQPGIAARGPAGFSHGMKGHGRRALRRRPDRLGTAEGRMVSDDLCRSSRQALDNVLDVVWAAGAARKSLARMIALRDRQERTTSARAQDASAPPGASAWRALPRDGARASVKSLPRGRRRRSRSRRRRLL